MEQSSFQDEQTVRHQFDSLCKLALKSEVINYEKHMAYRQKYEVMLSELSEKELSRLFIMEEHEMETHRFQVLGYDIYRMYGEDDSRAWARFVIDVAKEK